MKTKCRKVVIVNRKGGVGKTMTATHLAGGLAMQGYNVLLADTDPQGNASTALGLPRSSGLYRLLVDNAGFDSVLQEVEPERITVNPGENLGHLFILPGDDKTQAIPILDKNPFNFRNRLEQVDSAFDFCIIDTAPTLNYFDGAVYHAADFFLYVTECEKLSVEGLNNGLAQLEEFSKERIQPARVLGIQPNSFREGTANHAAFLLVLREQFGDGVWTPIPQRTGITEATSAGQLIYAYEPNGASSALLKAMTSRVLKEIEDAR